MMKTITVDLYTFEHQELHIGRVGENLHVRFVIDVSEYVDGMSAPSVAMTIENANGLRYPGAAFLDGTNVVWMILGGDLVADGVGYAQLTIMDGEEIVKSATATTRVEPSLTADGEMPDPIEDFVEHAGEVMDTILGIESRVTQAAVGAEVARYGAETAQGKAEDAQHSAEAAMNSSNFASREALEARSEAQAAQLNAQAAATAAQTAQGLAETAQAGAEAAQSGAEAAQAAAEAAQTAAEAAQAAAEEAEEGAEAAAQAALEGLIDDTSTASNKVWSAEKVSTVTAGKMEANLKGANGGVAELDANGKVPSAQLPSYVDDVVEYATRSAFPSTGESGKIYVALDTNTTYRWTGATYAGVGSSLALGETESTAYRGDRGKAAYEAAVANPDAAPTEGSNDLVKSGGVYTALEQKANKSHAVFTNSVSMGRKANTVRGTNSAVLGSYVEASGRQSQAFGTQVTANGDHQMVSGSYNVADSMDNVEAFVPNKQYRKGEIIKYSSNGGSTYNLYIFKEDYSGASLNMYKVDQLYAGMTKNIRIIGNGMSESARRNAHTLDWGGNAEFAGDVKAQACGGANPVSLVETSESVSGKANVNNPQFTGYMSLGRKSGTTAGSGSIALGSEVEASGTASFAEGSNTKAAGSADHAEGESTETASGGMPGNHAEGWRTKATGGGAHAENNQTVASGNSSHAEGILTTASGQAAHTEGIQTTASKATAHAEGQGTTASGEESHSEGLNTTASGAYSHAEGSNATASAQGSHAEGINTSASGLASHAEGTGVEAPGVSSHAGGKYNIPDSIDDYPLWVSGTHYYVGDIVRKDTSSTYPYRCITENSDTTYTSSKWTPHQYLKHAEVIGNGTSNNARSNARTLTWEGTEEVAGDVVAYGCGGNNPISVRQLSSALTVLEPSASAGDVGKFLKAKTVADGKVTEYEFGSGSGGGSDIDDTAGEGDTDKVWSANKLTEKFDTIEDLQTATKTGYLKPFVQGSVTQSTGVIDTTSTSSCYIGKIPMKAGDSISYNRSVNKIITYCTLAIYNSSGTFIRGLTVATGASYTFTEDGMFAICCPLNSTVAPTMQEAIDAAETSCSASLDETIKIVSTVNRNTSDITRVENEITKIKGMTFTKSDLKTGVYYKVSNGVVSEQTESTAKYHDMIDVSALRGMKMYVWMKSPRSGSSRSFGFCDAQKNVGNYATETSMIKVADGGSYKILIIDKDYMFFSCSSDPTEIHIDISKNGSFARHLQTDSALDNTKFYHMSFDDVILCLKDITTNASTYESVFENDFLGWCKSMHDLYGTTFSLYVFNQSESSNPTWTLSDCTDAFASEFTANADWLRFGFHAFNSSQNATARAESAATDYSTVITQLVRITGSAKCIDRVPRLHEYSGTLAVLTAMRDCDVGPVGFIASADTAIETPRDSYYFDADENAYMFKHAYMYDAENHLHFVKTCYLWNTSNVDVTNAENSVTYSNRNRYAELFTHENQLTSGTKSTFEGKFTALAYSHEPYFLMDHVLTN